MSEGGRLTAMVVSRQRENAAMAGGTGRVRVLQRIDGAVHARALAVPDAEHAIDLGTRKQPNLLAAPDRGRSKVLVQAREEGDVLGLQEGFRAPQRVVVHAERRTAVTGDETAGVEPRRAVAF